MFERLSYLDAFDRHQKRRDDVALSVFVENELKQVIPEMFDVLFPNLDAMEHIPIGTGINPGAMSWAYDSVDKRGQAKIIGGNATDIPRADVSKRRFTFPIRSIALAYGWSVEEILAARFAQVPLDRLRAEATRRGIAELEHNLLLFGDQDYDLPGFLTNPSVPLVVVPNGDWLNPATTSDQILADMNAVVDQVWLTSEKVHRPTTMLVDNARMRLISTKRIPDTDISIMDYFMRSNGFIQEVRALTELESGAVTTGGGPRVLAYEKSPRNLTGVVPLSFDQLEPQMKGFEVLIPTWSRQGGTVWYYPFAGAFGEGV